jgi:hypothetical protein
MQGFAAQYAANRAFICRSSGMTGVEVERNRERIGVE